MKKLMAATLTTATLLGSTAAALAQSAPAPVGIWQSNSGETLIVGETCQISANGVVSAIGACGWSPTAAGGILTIINVNAYQPAPVYFNINWIDGATISVFGDTFHRQQ
jgi:hypothetical protein